MIRNWRKHWRGIETKAACSVDEALCQVGKTVMGQPVSARHLGTIVDAIAAGLDLKPESVIVDLGCGNGIVTERVADRVARIAGIDVSEPLIEAARTHRARPNCTYHVGDLAELDQFPIEGVTKTYCYEVLQHLSTEETGALLGTLIEQLGDGLVFFAGSIPERARLGAFYNTPERWTHYERRLAEGTEQIGHWWERDELIALCNELGLTCTPLDQAASLYTSHYRFDARITAPSGTANGRSRWEFTHDL